MYHISYLNLIVTSYHIIIKSIAIVFVLKTDIYTLYIFLKMYVDNRTFLSVSSTIINVEIYVTLASFFLVSRYIDD